MLYTATSESRLRNIQRDKITPANKGVTRPTGLWRSIVQKVADSLDFHPYHVGKKAKIARFCTEKDKSNEYQSAGDATRSGHGRFAEGCGDCANSGGDSNPSL